MSDSEQRLEGLVKALSQKRVSRRAFLRRATLLGLSLPAASAILAACAPAAAPTPTAAPAATAAPAPTATPAPAATAAPAATEAPTAPAVVTPVKQYGGSGVADRAIEGARALNLKGKTIRLFHPAGMESNWEPFVPEWREATGIDVKGSSVGYFEVFPKAMSAAVAGLAEWDLLNGATRDMGELAGAGAVLELGPWMEKYGAIISGEPYGYIPPLDKAMVYRGKYYGVGFDSDPFFVLVRKDHLEDPKEQQAFKAKYGYDLKIPDTWAQYRDHAEFFTRPPDLWGAFDLHAKGGAPYQWLVYFVSKRIPNMYFFDDEMHPLINSPEGIKATEEFLAMKPFMPPDIATWDWSQQYPGWANGQAHEVIYLPSLKKFSEGADSKVKGKVDVGLVPGSVVDGKVHRRSTVAYGEMIYVWAKSPIAEAAYLFAQWLASPELTPRVTAQPGYVDLMRFSDLESPLVEDVYGAEILSIFRPNMSVTIPDLTLAGYYQYYDALDAKLGEAWSGAITAEQAVKEAAEDWEKITDKIGREGQIEQWRYLKSAWPTT